MGSTINEQLSIYILCARLGIFSSHGMVTQWDPIQGQGSMDTTYVPPVVVIVVVAIAAVMVCFQVIGAVGYFSLKLVADESAIQFSTPP